MNSRGPAAGRSRHRSGPINKRRTAMRWRDRSKAAWPVLVSPSHCRAPSVRSFRSMVWRNWKRNGRHDLPWRRPTLKLRSGKENFDPYRIMVSEVMLQQTQVSRVLEKYFEFLKRFPTIQKLARAEFSDVGRAWSGLGYNRRAKYLYEAAKIIVHEHHGIVPKNVSELEALPGIGPYTARAIVAFAYNKPAAFIETNIRTAFIHHFFNTAPPTRKIHDRELLVYVEKAAEGQPPREWYSALMDYGAYVKQTKGNASRRSAHHAQQKPFKGSNREARGLILKIVQDGPAAEEMLQKKTKLPRQRFQNALEGLTADGLVRKVRGRWMIA